jgi:hypothetical protein
MKNTESIGWLYDWFTFSPDYVHGMKQNKSSSLAKGYDPLYSSSPLASLDGFSRSHSDG